MVYQLIKMKFYKHKEIKINNLDILCLKTLVTLIQVQILIYKNIIYKKFHNNNSNSSNNSNNNKNNKQNKKKNNKFNNKTYKKKYKKKNKKSKNKKKKKQIFKINKNKISKVNNYLHNLI